MKIINYVKNREMKSAKDKLNYKKTKKKKKKANGRKTSKKHVT